MARIASRGGVPLNRGRGERICLSVVGATRRGCASPDPWTKLLGASRISVTGSGIGRPSGASTY